MNRKKIFLTLFVFLVPTHCFATGTVFVLVPIIGGPIFFYLFFSFLTAALSDKSLRRGRLVIFGITFALNLVVELGLMALLRVKGSASSLRPLITDMVMLVYFASYIIPVILTVGFMAVPLWRRKMRTE